METFEKICQVVNVIVVASLWVAGFCYLWHGYGDMATACFIGSLAWRL